VTLGLEFKLLLGSVSTSFCRLELDLELYCFEVATFGSSSTNVSHLVSQVIDNLLLFGDLDSQLLFFTRHKLGIVLHLIVIKGTSLSILRFLVSHQLLQQAFELTDDSFLLLHCVFIQSRLLVVLGKDAKLAGLFFECHLEVLVFSLDLLGLSKINIGRLKSLSKLFITKAFTTVGLCELDNLRLKVID